jgi:beta-glucosidase-like glycosyl hydrolase/CubicO group peptidase (beta-lactamase class C family)
MQRIAGIMKKSRRKLMIIFGAALIIGVFVQFSIGHKDFNEVVLPSKKQLPPFLHDSVSWGDSAFYNLTLREKVAQMIMVPVYPEKGQADKDRVSKQIKNNKVGGLIIFHGDANEIVELITYYQSISKIPLLIAIDGEWGASMRIKNTIKYPKQMMLGAISDEMLIYQMGSDIASQLKQLGIHINFAPIVDVNNNPGNPVINSRSFGEERVNVARKSLLYMKGMQDNGILAVAKHFPGHGDTKTDSHESLPIISHSRERLDSIELYPFRALINAGVAGIMVAHLNVPAMDTTSNLPATLSPVIVDSILQKQMTFRGLIFTDAMGMGGITENHIPVQANVQAFQAGNDIILMPAEIENTIEAVVMAIEEGKIDPSSIDKSCQKIIKAKEWFTASGFPEEYSASKLITDEFLLNRQRIIEAAITVFNNKNNIIPLKRLDTLKIAHINLGPDKGAKFLESLSLYTEIKSFRLKNNQSQEEWDDLLKQLSDYNLIITSLHSSSIHASDSFGIHNKDIGLIDTLLTKYPVILANFSNPYIFSRIKNLENALACIAGFENDQTTQHITAEVIFGYLGANGKLPVTVNKTFTAGTGIRTQTINRFGYVTPFEAGFDKKKLEIVDSIIENAIAEKAMPGCQVLASRNGKVFFSQNYGYHTYWKKRKVKSDDIYDLASLTKIAATLPTIMKLQSEKKINIDDPLKSYISYLDTSAKGDLILSDILLHQAGLTAWIPFYWSLIEPIYPSQDLMRSKYSSNYPIRLGPRAYANKHLKLKEGYISKEVSEDFPYKIAEAMYLRKDYADSMWITILNSEIKKPGKYKYSDLGFYIFNKIIQDITNTTLDNYVDSLFYKPLGASTLCFNPLEKFPKNRIVPTENDLVFRKQVVHGYVHDPGAAMLGGVCGHAGLFGSANDLAKLMQVYLNNGRYGSKNYISRKTISRFTSCQACSNGNRRGLGFDKPQPDTNLPGPSFKGISTDSYGHTGFTGTMTWADPETGIMFIFLSNRVYPDASNSKLVKLDVRTKVQKAIYDALLKDE